MREHHFELTSVGLNASRSLAGFDCVLLATDHDSFDFGLIGSHAALLVDTRGRYRKPQPNVVKA